MIGAQLVSSCPSSTVAHTSCKNLHLVGMTGMVFIRLHLGIAGVPALQHEEPDVER